MPARNFKPLPYADRAFIPQPPDHRFNKLKDYALNPDHETGSHKAALFKRHLGFEQDDWHELQNQILNRLPACPFVGIPRLKIVDDPDPKRRIGLGFEVHIPIDGHDGRRCQVLTAWRLDAYLEPFLSTAYPLG